MKDSKVTDQVDLEPKDGVRDDRLPKSLEVSWEATILVSKTVGSEEMPPLALTMNSPVASIACR